MREPTAATLRLRAALTLHRRRVDEVLDRYAALNPRLFGSVARGEACEDSDLDLLVDLAPGAGNEMLRVSGLAEELSELLGVRVDVETKFTRTARDGKAEIRVTPVEPPS